MDVLGDWDEEEESDSQDGAKTIVIPQYPFVPLKHDEKFRERSGASETMRRCRLLHEAADYQLFERLPG